MASGADTMLLFGTFILCRAIGTFAAPETYGEDLTFTSLPRNHVLASFTFDMESSATQSSHASLLPRSLVQVFVDSHSESLKLRFTRGRWQQATWGPLPRSGLYAGGRGAELSVTGLNASSEAAKESWRVLVNSLSGMFCASLNYIDDTRTIAAKTGISGSLPGETVCTENLTPFLKLLPCKHAAGIAQLLRGHDLDNTEWLNLAVEVVGAHNGRGLRVRQVVDFVVDLERILAATTGSVPGSQPTDDLICADGKFYTTDVTCLPVDVPRTRQVTLKTLFPHGSFERCSLQQQDEVIIWHNDASLPTTHAIDSAGDLHLPLDPSARIVENPMQVRRSIIMQGSSLRGQLSTTFVNGRDWPVRARYHTVLPWYLRPLLHTTRLNRDGEFRMLRHESGKDRSRPHTIVVDIVVPARDSIELTLDFERTILRYGEYPPDANRGFDVAAGIVYLDEEDTHSEIRTTNLLLPLPTPDFSMPYNVIILTSTVIALLFGGTFNLLLRSLVIASSDSSS